MKNKRLFLLPVLLLFAMSIVLPALAAVDDSYTKALLHFDGSDGSTTLTDESGKTWTASGNAQLDTDQSKFGTASLLLDGNGDYISSADSDDWYLSGDFTIDFWVRFTSLPSSSQIINMVRQYESSTKYWTFRLTEGSGIYSLHFLSNNSGTIAQSSYYTISLSTDTWMHLAVVKNGNNYYFFKDGTSLGSASSDTDVIGNYSAPLVIGNNVTTYLNGWIDEFRLSNGIARWTSNFTPPSAQYEPTPTPTATNTATNTSTPTDTPTPTNTATDTPTSTATYTPTATDTPTITPTFTNTSTTPTDTPTITPTVPTSTPVTPAVTIVPEITYGEYAVTLTTAALCLVIIVIFLVAIGLYTSQRTRSKL